MELFFTTSYWDLLTLPLRLITSLGQRETRTLKLALFSFRMLHVRRLMTAEMFAFLFVGSEILPIHLQQVEKGVGISL